MKVEVKDVSSDAAKGFAKIVNLEKAQQVKVKVTELCKLLSIAKILKDLGFEDVYITVEKGFPLIIGGKIYGFALATLEDYEEKMNES